MKQEFITSIGRVIQEKEVLFFKNPDFRFHHTILYELVIPVGWIIVTITKFASAEKPFDYFFGIIIGVLAILHGYPLYDVLFRRSLSTRIPLRKIVAFEIKESNSQLETYVILHLKSGRYKKIAFRTLEKQYEPFVDLISQYSTQPQTS